MTSDEILEILNLDLPRYKHNDPPPLHPCTDVCAMLVLSSFVPKRRRIIYKADFGIVRFDLTMTEVEAQATEEQIRVLNRCGVFYMEETDSWVLSY